MPRPFALKSLAVAIASAATVLTVDVAAAQPGPYGHSPPRGAPYGPYAGQHYYNGRWVGPDEWARRSHERDRWARDYEHRRHRDHDDSSALVAGIIGFALGAAIVGSQQEAEHARSADRSWDAYCARKYRTYDPHSRTYLGADGLRHYCR